MQISKLPSIFINKFHRLAHTVRQNLAREPIFDIFERRLPENNQLFLQIYNPFIKLYISGKANIDLNKKCVFKLYNELYSDFRKNKDAVEFTYNPLNIGTVYKKTVDPKTRKVIKTPFEVNILSSSDNVHQTAYHFMTKDLSEEIGYVNIGDLTKLKKNKINEYLNFDERYIINYPAYGITGDRITVNFLKNWDTDNFGGVGELADRLEIEYCIKNNITPCIVSEAERGAEIAHYKRGKRFLPLYNKEQREAIMNRYGTDDVNKVIENLLKNRKQNKKVKLKGFPETLMMYLPEEKVNKYIALAKEHPLLHE